VWAYRSAVVPRIPGWNGPKIGRPYKLSPSQIRAMVSAAQRGMTGEALARRFKVSRATVVKYLKLAAGK
jgi:DNA-binding MarR family transcriptional regulator